MKLNNLLLVLFITLINACVALPKEGVATADNTFDTFFHMTTYVNGEVLVRVSGNSFVLKPFVEQERESEHVLVDFPAVQYVAPDENPVCESVSVETGDSVAIRFALWNPTIPQKH